MFDLDKATWDDKLIGGLDFISKSVLQVPFLFMTLMRYVTPTLDEMFVKQKLKVRQCAVLIM